MSIGQFVPVKTWKSGRNLIAEDDPLPSQFATERGMFGPDALRNSHQTAIDFKAVNLSKRGEHRPQLEPDEPVAEAAMRW